MIAVLGEILAGIELFGSYVLWGLETFINGIGAAMVALLAALVALLPTMPSIGTLSGTWLGWLNWFFPVGDFLTIITTAVALYITFLVVRWALRVIRAL